MTTPAENLNRFNENFTTPETAEKFWADFDRVWNLEFQANTKRAKTWADYGTKEHQDARPAFGPTLKRIGRGRDRDRDLGHGGWNSRLWSGYNQYDFEAAAEARGYKFVRTNKNRVCRIERTV